MYFLVLFGLNGLQNLILQSDNQDPNLQHMTNPMGP